MEDSGAEMVMRENGSNLLIFIHVLALKISDSLGFSNALFAPGWTEVSI